LTTGSGLVGLHLLRLERGSTLTGIDIDCDAVETAERNARVLELSARARFECGDLWSAATKESIESVRPHLLICNPPYIPEPQGLPLELEAAAASQTLWESSPTASTRGPFIHTSGRFRAPG
jgi:methylase of polypeptide subunit release factors